VLLIASSQASDEVWRRACAVRLRRGGPASRRAAGSRLGTTSAPSRRAPSRGAAGSRLGLPLGTTGEPSRRAAVSRLGTTSALAAASAAALATAPATKAATGGAVVAELALVSLFSSAPALRSGNNR
jgi:hypothetical protein